MALKLCACAFFLDATGHPDTRYLELIFGGRKPAHFRCTKCKRKYDLDGKPIDG